MKLEQYLDGMRQAQTSEELEAAIQMPFKHSFRGLTWSRICSVRIEAGKRIVAAHPNSFFIPHFGEKRQLTCCGETSKVGRGYNSAGASYVWHGAGVWAMSLLRKNGFGIRASNRLWDSSWNEYPHRCIALVDDILAGKVPDPELNVLIRREGHSPIRYTQEENNADKWDYRAHRPCNCGGTLFDWGGGYSEGFNFVSWHCNACPDVFTEYMTDQQHRDLRQRKVIPQPLLQLLL